MKSRVKENGKCRYKNLSERGGQPRCHQAMLPWGKVLLVERVILTGSTPQVLVLESDVQILVMAGGKERTEAEYRALLNAAGFELTRLIPVLTPFYVIEAVRV